VDDLLMKVDKMGMLASIEARVPYLDHHVVEFVLTLGGHLKVGWRARKRLLKKLVASRLPNEILNRPKHGFTVPVAEWLRGPLLGTFHDAVMANRSHSDWLDHNYVERLLAEHRKGKNLGLKLWSILIFCLWCQSATAKTGLASVSASSNSNR